MLFLPLLNERPGFHTPVAYCSCAVLTAFGTTTFRERVSLLSLPSPSDVSLP